MHEMSPGAKIVYASSSITDILGYEPYEIKGTPLQDLFLYHQLPFAVDPQAGVMTDNACMLAYCDITQQSGERINCECVFNVVYDIMVAAITVYRASPRSLARAVAAPLVQDAFQTPDGSREKMLRVVAPPQMTRPMVRHEIRACLILNRFSRSLSILYASHAIAHIVGSRPDDLVGKSIYHCIDPSCVHGCVEAVERAKFNDSIAYLRFPWQNPSITMRQQDSRRSSGSSSSNSSLDEPPTDIEAVLSCTSDGVLMVLCQARPFTTIQVGPYAASPWSYEPETPEQEIVDHIGDLVSIAWGMGHADDLTQQHGRGTPGPGSRPDP